jgi:hypothetical protein
MGPLIILALGAAAGVFCHLRWHRFWAASVVATFAATLLWGGGCYLLFALTAPSELGPPLLVPVLLTVATAAAGALVAGAILRAARPR